MKIQEATIAPKEVIPNLIHPPQATIQNTPTNPKNRIQEKGTEKGSDLNKGVNLINE